MIRKYSKIKDGEKQVTPNFKVREFACRDGTDEILICDEVAKLLQAIRSYFNKPLVINSGYRTPAYNNAVKGALDSQHLHGKAADFNVTGVTPIAVRSAIESGKIPLVDPTKIGLGYYNDFTHIDSRGKKARF